MSQSRKCRQCNESISITDQILEDLGSQLECPCCGDTSLKRQEHERVKKLMTLFFYVDGKKREAVTIDVSDSGAKIFYLGFIPLPVNKEVRVDIKELSIRDQKAVVVWSHKLADTYSHTGLKFVN